LKPHPQNSVEKRFILSIILTAIILVAEVIGGLWTHSLALLSDSAHVFLDLFALGLSYVALRLSALPVDDRHSYGYHRLEVLAALINGLTLGIISLGIYYESWQRWRSPQPIRSLDMLAIAVIGLVVNLVVALVLNQKEHAHLPFEREDLNVKSAFLHVVGDAISSVGVILAALIIWRTGWQWVDPLMSILIGTIIFFSAGRVLRSSLHILIEGVPEGLSLVEIGKALKATPGVQDIHDLHVWSVCSGTIALSAHIIIADQGLKDSQVIIDQLKKIVSEKFGIEHTTIQLECLPCGQGHALDEVALTH
jgi:cobalt-zinc-cadmium efflux system protein